MTVGRPTKLTSEVQEKICYAIRLGAVYEHACNSAGVSYDSHRLWMRKGEKAKSGKFYDYFNTVNSAIEEGKSNAQENAQKKLDAKNKHRRKYRNRKEKGTKFVYLIRESFMGLVRIGVAKDIKARMSVHVSSCPQQLEIIRYFEVKNPLDLEYVLHNKYKHQRYNGSWYNLSQSDIDEIVDYLADFEQELYTGKSTKRSVLNHKIDEDVLENSVQLSLDF